MRSAALLAILLGCGRPAPPPSAFQEPQEDFEPFGEPKPGDWQHRFREEPQSFDDYVGSDPNRPTAKRRVFRIQPLGDLPARILETIAAMRDYAEIFFGVAAKVCDPVPMFENGFVKSRGQYNAGMIIGQLTERAPADAVVYIGITDQDLFSEGLNFVFGQGSLRDRTGVYSLRRYETRDAALFLRRSLKLMAHEVGHIFSIHHCVTWKCVMNGANSLEEDDRHPMHLCPIDLRKLQWNVGFDAKERYRKLAEFYRKRGLKAEAEWTERHLARLR